MKNNEKAAPVLQHRDGSGQIALEGFQAPQQKNTIPGHGIASLLLHGEVNAIPLQALVNMTGQDRRVIRRTIQAERRAGACICVNNRDGYYLAETIAERDQCSASMKRRAAEVYRTAAAIAAAEVE